ncbi:ecotin family protein [Zhouia spongiae]|uniref:Ecotin family protein n=1 Tax=Zhouia spongiae TaxID=2202721 RepID=A0ABY3YLS5_9FLAO|nr:ecotin family protein [Zhouia spongiae]UNY98749.1 ecotin family protein [Zhouia spongiae]
MKTISYKLAGISLIAFLCLTSVAMGQSSLRKTDLSVFPKPEKGFKQMVIEVPHSDNDAQKRIEFVVGKWMEVDTCNKHGLQGSIEEKDLKGWGYNYYIFNTNGNVMSTQMACLDKKMVSKFISGQPKMVRYNGKLPVVIYVPEGYDVQFKIFKAEEDVYQAGEVKQ